MYYKKLYKRNKQRSCTRETNKKATQEQGTTHSDSNCQYCVSQISFIRKITKHISFMYKIIKFTLHTFFAIIKFILHRSLYLDVNILLYRTFYFTSCVIHFTLNIIMVKYIYFYFILFYFKHNDGIIYSFPFTLFYFKRNDG